MSFPKINALRTLGATVALAAVVALPSAALATSSSLTMMDDATAGKIIVQENKLRTIAHHCSASLWQSDDCMKLREATGYADPFVSINGFQPDYLWHDCPVGEVLTGGGCRRW
jgi:hypothetical protein